MSESVTLLPQPKDIKIGEGTAFIKAHGGMLLQTAPNTNLIANDDSEGAAVRRRARAHRGHERGWWRGTGLVMTDGRVLVIDQATTS